MISNMMTMNAASSRRAILRLVQNQRQQLQIVRHLQSITVGPHQKPVAAGQQQQQQQLHVLAQKKQHEQQQKQHSSKVRSRSASIPDVERVKRAVEGVMNKEFPGYFDKDHHKYHAPESPVIDIGAASRAEKKDGEGDSNDKFERPLSKEVEACIGEHHSVDEVLVVDIRITNKQELIHNYVRVDNDDQNNHCNGKTNGLNGNNNSNDGDGDGMQILGMNEEIPVAFVVCKPDACEYIDPHNELHDQLLNSVRGVLTKKEPPKYSKRRNAKKCVKSHHEELTRDLLGKIDEMLLHDVGLRKDMIRDEIVQHVRNRFGSLTPVKVVLVDALPCTASGKSMRGTLYKIARGEPFVFTKLINDHVALKQIEAEIHKLIGATASVDEQVVM